MNSEKHLRRHRHEDDFDELPLPKNERKTTTVAATHSEIMNEMEHLFVRFVYFQISNERENLDF